MSDADPPKPPDAAALREAAGRFKAHARALDKLAATTDPAGLRSARRAFDKLADPPLSDQLSPLLQGVDAWLDHEAATRRPRLAQGLRDAAAAADIELLVLTREPLELRLPPLGVAVDIDRDRATITFGRQTLVTCAAQTDAVMAARQQALDDLHAQPWDPVAFHAALLAAWRLAGDDWQELATVLPLLALTLQGARFKKDPTARNFSGYSRARLAFDLWRLRRDRALSQDGWRLTLGSATGGSTRDKGRVFWLEDDQGRGQYYLTLRFVRDGADG